MSLCLLCGVAVVKYGVFSEQAQIVLYIETKPLISVQRHSGQVRGGDAPDKETI
jgi:hypothetical protein